MESIHDQAFKSEDINFGLPLIEMYSAKYTLPNAWMINS